MEVFIYWHGPSGVPRDEIEDVIEDVLGDRGEVTGAGSGMSGSNVDLEIFDDAGADQLLAEVVSAIRHSVPDSAYYHFAYDETQHFIHEFPDVPMELQAASDGICAGFNAAGPFRCAFNFVQGTTVVSHLVGRIPEEDARRFLREWASGPAAAMIKQPLGLVGATAWEARYNGVPVLVVPI